MEEKRSYQRTSFWLFALCLLITVVSDYTGISIKDATTYADGIIRKTFENMNSLAIWIMPLAIIIKEELAAWRKSLHDRDIEVAKITGKTP